MAKNKITIEKMFGGIALDPVSGSATVSDNASRFGDKDQHFTLFNDTSSNPVIFTRPAFYKYMTPGLGSTVVTGIDGVVLNIAGSMSLGSSYLYVLTAEISGSNKIYQYETDTFTVSSSYSIPTSVAGPISTYGYSKLFTGDILSYTTPNITTAIAPTVAATPSSNYIYYTWQDLNNSHIGRVRTGLFPTVDSDTIGSISMNGNTALGGPAKMWIGTTGQIFITNGNSLAYIDEKTGVSSTSVISFNTGFVASSGCVYYNYNAIVGYKQADVARGTSVQIVNKTERGESRLWLWDGTSAFINSEYVINDTYVTAVYNHRGKLYVFSYGLEGTTKIWRFNGNGFDLLESRQDIGPYVGHGSVDTYMNGLIFTSYSDTNGNIYMYGDESSYSGKGLSVLANTGNINGSIKVFSSNSTSTPTTQNTQREQIILGTQTDTTNSGNSFMRRLNFSTFNNSANNLFRSTYYELPPFSNITAFKFYLAQFTSGSSVTLNVFKGYYAYNSTPIYTYTFNGSGTGGGYAGMTYFPILTTIDSLDVFYITLNMSGTTSTDFPAIRRIEILHDGNELNV